MSINRRGIPLPGSPSISPNNLSSGYDCIAFVRMNDVYQLTLNGESKRIPITTRCQVTQVSIVEIYRKQFIVIASSIGAQIWTSDGNTMIHFLSLSNIYESELDENDQGFMRGVAATGEYICIGTSGGTCCVLQVRSDFEENIELRHKLPTSPIPISDMGGSQTLLVASNENGDIFCFDPCSAFECFASVPGCGFVCTSIRTRGLAVIAGFSTGHIRMLRASTEARICELVVEITAHSQCISGLCIHPDRNVVASCGEDQLVQVWSFYDFITMAGGGDSGVNLLFSEKLENKILTGIAYFLDGRLGAVCYDDEEMVVFSSESQTF